MKTPYQILEGPLEATTGTAIGSAIFAGIFSKDLKKVLLVHKTLPGSWGLPGGTVEKGEKMKSALFREMEEETSLDKEQVVFAYFDILFYRPLRSAFFRKVVPTIVSVAVFKGSENNYVFTTKDEEEGIDGGQFFPADMLPENMNPHHAEYIKVILREAQENENLRYALFCLT